MAETIPKDVAEEAFLLSFAKPPPILGFLPRNKSLNKIMHPPATWSEHSPKLYGANLLKNPDLMLDRKEIKKAAVIKNLSGWADKTAIKNEREAATLRNRLLLLTTLR